MQTQSESNQGLSPKLEFLMINFTMVVKLEQELKQMLRHEEIVKDPILVVKLWQDGWLPFKDVFALQTQAKDERTFFQALSFMKNSVQLCEVKSKDQAPTSKPPAIDNLVIKMSPTPAKQPQLNFGVRTDKEEELKALLTDSIFIKHFAKMEFMNAEIASKDKENHKRAGFVRSDFESVISGLKKYLGEVGTELTHNITENFFNLDAQPFRPAAKKAALSNPLDLNSFATTKSATAAGEPQPAAGLQKKQQISQMYQYYNYLIFEKNKESFNDINPDLRKMTYKYDNEVKNSYMTVTASPEVIKAAMGMNIPQAKQPVSAEDPGKP